LSEGNVIRGYSVNTARVLLVHSLEQ